MSQENMPLYLHVMNTHAHLGFRYCLRIKETEMVGIPDSSDR